MDTSKIQIVVVCKNSSSIKVYSDSEDLEVVAFDEMDTRGSLREQFDMQLKGKREVAVVK
jgi:hypothetical protein